MKSAEWVLKMHRNKCVKSFSFKKLKRHNGELFLGI